MPDRRTHRGPHPQDENLFAPQAWPRLQDATRDYSWLLTRGYAAPSSLKIVGDRYTLDQRQRMAVTRSSCSDPALERRRARQVTAAAIVGAVLRIDGFNLLTTVEVALAGGVVLDARDGCLRDIAGVHGTYRKVEETRPAILLAGQTLERLRPGETIWYFDRPVGNSGRLKAFLLDVAGERGWAWEAQVVANPDRVLVDTTDPIATADSAILDQCVAWFNLAREIIALGLPQAHLIPIAGPGCL